MAISVSNPMLKRCARVSPSSATRPDFIEAGVGGHLAQLKQRGIRVVSNAGGINPQACAARLRELAAKQGVELKIAVVSGDDLSKRDLSGLTEMFTGQPLPQRLNSVHAYLGAGAIRAALDAGAELVVTGRCADSALALGPLAHAFDWRWDDWDRLAAGSLAGHLLECGAQSTGGISTDWRRVPDWHRIGFPIADCGADGDLVLTKPPGTGGLVSVGTVAEQLVYEIGDPRRYLLPDVACDFSQVRLAVAADGVAVSGARGRPPTDSYKVCGTHLDGYSATAVCPVIGPAAAEKAHRTAEAILARCRDIFAELKLADFSRTHVQVLGAEETYPDGPAPPRREAVLWLAVSHADKRALQVFGREVAPAGTGMAPGLTGLVGGRPKPTPVLRLVSFLVPKRDVDVSVDVDGADVPFTVAETAADASTPTDGPAEAPPAGAEPPGAFTYRLERVALTRSGDKGDSCNIGVVARSPALYPHLCRELTAERVAAYFARLLPAGVDPTSLVDRYELPGVHALNFVLRQSLGGGGIASLRP
ncbi:hypothetical protein FJT64_011026 [Amphibalanus amphitrite]|uniref:Uncharacterized protein n=1 Tax=Amphibalanus amphitrite TaxID=1232801 RepID=A0A6A4VAT1_AMPAM|nr:hypothetical protein FJT64_011026 [Amphibalanus amphitrite]